MRFWWFCQHFLIFQKFQGYTPEQLQWTVVEQNATMFRQQANEMNPVLQQNNAQQQANAQLPFQTMTGLHQAAHVQQTHTGGLTPLTPQQQQPQSQQQLFNIIKNLKEDFRALRVWCDFWSKLGLRFWIFVGYVEIVL